MVKTRSVMFCGTISMDAGVNLWHFERDTKDFKGPDCVMDQ